MHTGCSLGSLAYATLLMRTGDRFRCRFSRGRAPCEGGRSRFLGLREGKNPGRGEGHGPGFSFWTMTTTGKLGTAAFTQRTGQTLLPSQKVSRTFFACFAFSACKACRACSSLIPCKLRNAPATWSRSNSASTCGTRSNRLPRASSGPAPTSAGSSSARRSPNARPTIRRPFRGGRSRKARPPPCRRRSQRTVQTDNQQRLIQQ